MKKIFLMILSALLLAGCASNTKTTRVEVKGIEEVNYDKLMSLMKEDKQFILYIGRPDCGDCQQFEPLLKDYLNKHKNEGVYYINTKTYRAKAKAENAQKKDIAFYENLQKKLKFNWTPTLEVITNGKVGKQYMYLNEDYYEIKDRAKQIEKRKAFEQEFRDFMKDYYKEG